MIINVSNTSDELARAAADYAAAAINEAIEKKGQARILLSTGASQIETLQYLVQKDVPWHKVTMFHLDEYVGLPASHKASFRKYLKNRFVDVVHPGKVCFVDGEGDIPKTIATLTEEVRKAPIDVALVGIGENAHIAFNDPPADFDTTEAYIVVDLEEGCKKQQLGEGWFPSIEDVPSRAVTMTVYQIMQSEKIITIVPGSRKAEAVCQALSSAKADPEIPSSILKMHKDWSLFLDGQSSSNLIPQL